MRQVELLHLQYKQQYTIWWIPWPLFDDIADLLELSQETVVRKSGYLTISFFVAAIELEFKTISTFLHNEW